MGAKYAPMYILILTLILNIVGFFTSSAAIWPYGSIGLTLANGVTVGLLVHIITCIDPAMDELIEKRKLGFKQMPYVQDSGHVIQDQRCRICLIQAPKGTKHCRVCNICVQGFDHHCVWLNRCIGRKNYKHFLILITIVVINSAVTWVYHLSLLALWLSKSPQLAPISIVDGHMTLQLPLFPVLLYIWVVATMLMVCIGLFTCLPVMNLLFFHLRLVKNGKSTYMVIMEHRSRNGRNKPTITGTSMQSTLSEVRIIGSRGTVGPPSSRSVRDLPSPAPRVMEIERGQESPRYRTGSRDALPHAIP